MKICLLPGDGIGVEIVDAAVEVLDAAAKKFGFEIIDRNTLPHKVWLVCVKCPKFPDCGEIALKRSLIPNDSAIQDRGL